ncbi:MAG: AbrB/MazE/SpoVT family DNA-binding domain-containing protein [Patescibacteria group bacterium]
MIEHQFPKISGTTTVGERGQVVIPADIRSQMKLVVGEKLFVFTHKNELIGLVRAADFDKILEKMTSHFTENIRKIREQIKKKAS